jgi:hypothetical protein
VLENAEREIVGCFMEGVQVVSDCASVEPGGSHANQEMMILIGVGKDR